MVTSVTFYFQIRSHSQALGVDLQDSIDVTNIRYQPLSLGASVYTTTKVSATYGVFCVSGTGSHMDFFIIQGESGFCPGLATGHLEGGWEWGVDQSK